MILNSRTLLSSLQSYLHQTGAEVERLTVDPMVNLMIDWFRLVPIAGVERGTNADALVHRYGGWSEGCVTGFKFSVLRRVVSRDETGQDVEWFAGITLMFEPSRYASLPAFSTQSIDWQSIESFQSAIQSSPAYKISASVIPMGVVVESGGMR